MALCPRGPTLELTSLLGGQRSCMAEPPGRKAREERTQTRASPRGTAFENCMSTAVKISPCPSLFIPPRPPPPRFEYPYPFAVFVFHWGFLEGAGRRGRRVCATPRPGAAAPPTNQSVTKSSNWFLGLKLGGAAQLKKRKGPAKAASSPGTLFRSQGRCACSTRATTASGSAHRRTAGAPTACWAGSGLETVGAGAGRCEGDWGCMVGPQSGSGGTFLAHLLAPASWFSHRGGMGIGAHPASRVVSSAAIAQRSVCPAACRPSAVPSTPVRGAFLAQSRVTGTGPRCSGKQKALAEWRLSFPYTHCCRGRTAHLSPGGVLMAI